VSIADRSGTSSVRRAGRWGLGFVLLLLIGAGMASVPGGDDTVGQVRRFYEDNAGVVFLSQVVELVATLPLVLFLRGLAASSLVRAGRATTTTGVALVAASLLTLVPPLLLVPLHDRAPAEQVRALAVASDLTDVLLFATISGFAAVWGWAGRGPRWLRVLALLVGLAAPVRAVEILLDGHLLEVVAPLGFIVLVVAMSILLLRAGRGAVSRREEHT
jgi:hypothetical protein